MENILKEKDQKAYLRTMEQKIPVKICTSTDIIQTDKASTSSGQSTSLEVDSGNSVAAINTPETLAETNTTTVNIKKKHMETKVSSASVKDLPISYEYCIKCNNKQQKHNWKGKIKDPNKYCALDESGYCINCSYMENGCNVFDANIRNDGNVMKAKKKMKSVKRKRPTSHVLESVKSKAPQCRRGTETTAKKSDLKQNNAAAIPTSNANPLSSQKKFSFMFTDSSGTIDKNFPMFHMDPGENIVIGKKDFIDLKDNSYSTYVSGKQVQLEGHFNYVKMTCLGVNSLKFRRLNRKKDEFKEVVQNDSRTLKSGDHQIVFPQDESNQKKLTYTLFCQRNDQSQKTPNMDKKTNTISSAAKVDGSRSWGASSQNNVSRTSSTPTWGNSSGSDSKVERTNSSSGWGSNSESTSSWSADISKPSEDRKKDMNVSWGKQPLSLPGRGVNMAQSTRSSERQHSSMKRAGRGRGRHLTQPAWMTAKDAGGITNLGKAKGINACAKSTSGSTAPSSKATAVDFMNLSNDEEDGEVKEAVNGGRPASGRGRGRHLTKPAWMTG